MMRYALRLSLPDRPGMLGALATALGRAEIDIVALDVIERDDGISVDDVWVDADLDAQQLLGVCEAVRGVVVEALTPARPADNRVDDIALAALVAEDGDDPLHALVTALPGTIGVTWAVAVTDGADGLEVLTSCGGTPDIPPALRLPFLPLKAPIRIPPAAWMPSHWHPGGGRRLELGAVPLGTPVAAVMLARINGARFRPAELRRAADLARVAVASSDRAPVPALG